MSDDFAQRALHLTADDLKLVNGSVALFTFVCVLIQLIWKPDSREAAHAYAAEHFNSIVRVSPKAEASDVASSIPYSEGLDVRGLPPIPQTELLRLKRLHLQQLRISELLEVDPWMEIPKKRFAAIHFGSKLPWLSGGQLNEGPKQSA